MFLIRVTRTSVPAPAPQPLPSPDSTAALQPLSCVSVVLLGLPLPFLELYHRLSLGSRALRSLVYSAKKNTL